MRVCFKVEVVGFTKCFSRKAQFLFLSMYLHSATAQSPHETSFSSRERVAEKRKMEPTAWDFIAKDYETLKALSGIKSHISCVPELQHFNIDYFNHTF